MTPYTDSDTERFAPPNVPGRVIIYRLIDYVAYILGWATVFAWAAGDYITQINISNSLAISAIVLILLGGPGRPTKLLAPYDE